MVDLALDSARHLGVALGEPLAGVPLRVHARYTREEALAAAPYLFLGPAHHVEHSGDRPIAITWRLEHAMPTDFFTTASVVAG